MHFSSSAGDSLRRATHQPGERRLAAPRQPRVRLEVPDARASVRVAAQRAGHRVSEQREIGSAFREIRGGVEGVRKNPIEGFADAAEPLALSALSGKRRTRRSTGSCRTPRRPLERVVRLASRGFGGHVRRRAHQVCHEFRLETKRVFVFVFALRRLIFFRLLFFCRGRGVAGTSSRTRNRRVSPRRPPRRRRTAARFPASRPCARCRARTNASAFKRSRAMSRVRSKESAGNAYLGCRGVIRFAEFFFAVVAVAVAFVAVLAKASAASRTARFRSPRSAYSSTSAACAARGSCTTSRNPTTFTCETRSSRNRRSASSSRSNGVDRRFRIDTLEGPASGPSSRSQSRGLGNVRVWFLSTRLTTTGGSHARRPGTGTSRPSPPRPTREHQVPVSLDVVGPFVPRDLPRVASARPLAVAEIAVRHEAILGVDHDDRRRDTARHAAPVTMCAPERTGALRRTRSE